MFHVYADDFLSYFRGPSILAILYEFPVSVYLRAASGCYVFANRVFLRGLGMRPDQLYGKTDRDIGIIDDATLRRMEKNFARFKRASSPDKTMWKIRTRGVTSYLETTRIPLVRDGMFCGYIGIINDRTEAATLRERAIVDLCHSLTVRETDIARMIVSGIPRREAAQQLNIFPQTYDSILRKIKLKTGDDYFMVLDYVRRHNDKIN